MTKYLVLKLLLDSPSLDLNYVSKAGTALTVSCQFSKPHALDLILKKNPDVFLQDQQGKTCFDHCQNEECKNLLKAYQKLKGEAEEQKQNELKSEIKQNQDQDSGVFLPPKPPIVRGTLFKIGAFLFNMRERFFVINPDEGTLIRYKTKSHYPLKPLEVIPLKDITHIQMITKSWFMSSDYTYFEINYPNRQVLACKHEQAAKKWVEYLFQACVYSYYTETRNSFNQIQIQDNQVVELLDNANQQPIFGALGGSIKEAVKKFENQNKKDDKKKSNENNNDQAMTKISLEQNQKGMNNSKLTTKSNNTNAKPDSSNNLEQMSPGAPKGSSNPGSRNKLDGPSDSRKNRSPSPPSQDNKRPSSPTAPEDPNVDLGQLCDDKVTFDSFQIIKVLGAGSFGKVFLAKKKDTGNIYAIKALKKRPLIMKRQLRYAVTEANVLKMCNHPFILGLHFALQTPNYLYLVLDYCNGGDISSHLAYKRRFSEEEALFYIAELVLAIQHIHEKDVVYRDLKPENILIAGDGHIKLADFGLSKDNVTDQSKTKSFCGTPAYLSPEMLNNKGASKASDLYGIGAVLYEMLTGDPPYYNDDIPTMYKKIKEGNLTYPSYVSQKARNLINGLLDRNPKTRLGSQDREQLKRDPFFESIDWEKLYNKQYKPPITEFENSDIEDDFEDISDKKIFHDFDYEQHNHNINRVKQFSFVRKNLQ